MAIAEVLPALCQRWAPPYDIKLSGKLQYILANPLSDGVGGVKVTFTEGVPVAEVGYHEISDVTLALSARDFLTLAADEMDVTQALMRGDLKILHKAPTAIRFLRSLYRSYNARP